MTGFLFEGVRFFESTNLPEKSITATVPVNTAGAQTYNIAPLLFFGPQAVGVGIGGNNAQILLNNNDDFKVDVANNIKHFVRNIHGVPAAKVAA